MGIVSLVLVITCANLASLLLARAAARRREFAVRLAVGAGRGRLVRQGLTESLLLALIGGVAAIAFARFTSRALIALLSSGRSRPIALDTRPDAVILAFALAIAVVTSVLFGLAPALRATAVGERAVLQDAMRSRATRHGSLASILVALQTALSVVLVTGAALFARTLNNLVHVDAGFRRDGITLVSVEVPRAARDSTRDGLLALEVLDDLRAIPGVRAASVSGNLPLSGGGWTLPITLDDNAAAGRDEAEILTASPSYFDVFGIRLDAGRGFSLADGEGARPVAIVGETFVRQRFGLANPIGRRILLGSREQPFEIIGVVADVRSQGLRKQPLPAVYLSFFQGPNPQLNGGATIGLLTEPGRSVSLDVVRERVRKRSAFAAVNIRAFKDLVDASLVNERVMALLATFFGGLALTLAAIGLYGLLSFGVSRRSAEIGVRSALGATRVSVMWLVVSQAARLVTAGVVLGLPAVWATTRLVSGMLFGLAPTDPTTIASAVGVLAVVALIAAFLPARRAMRVSPMTALRSD
jgi:predicted permease